ncbi:hypothetical protein KA001_02725 [Patescibacteria group bacterium]|nr:hypothetical protein [Patescibacteria group bacterium]
MKNKKINLISLFVSFLLIATVIFFLKPNKFVTYVRAKFGISNTVLIYKLDKTESGYVMNKKEFKSFLLTRGISGTAYIDDRFEYYVTVVPKSVNPTTELDYGFKKISPEDFYKSVYNTKQAYFNQTMKVID